MAHMQTIKDYRKEIYKSKPKTITQSEYKLVRAQQKLKDNELESMKRSIFMLNKAEIIKDFRKDAIQEAERIRDIKLMTK